MEKNTLQPLIDNWGSHLTSWNKPRRPSPLTWVTRFIILLSFCIKCSITSPLDLVSTGGWRLRWGHGGRLWKIHLLHNYINQTYFTWFCRPFWNLSCHYFLQTLRVFLNKFRHLHQKVLYLVMDNDFTMLDNACFGIYHPCLLNISKAGRFEGLRLRNFALKRLHHICEDIWPIWYIICNMTVKLCLYIFGL